MTEDERRAELYATRRTIADRGLAELAEAIESCGPDADAYGLWVITDKLGLLPVQRVHCCRRDGSGWQPQPDTGGTRIEDLTRAFVVKGVTYYPMRFSIGFQALTEYRPQTPEQMKRAAEARQAKREAARIAASAADPQQELDL